ncbi:hypothetical protein FH972_007724 [Carpinus fangiana]|uniref:Uncharacterized protein n=1 Tax=Carpinus fangiana TaxID=176857 RepID=A0A5N6QZV8_9ROSI|nr:hypothetical protein FH972_007724 [Carpinus fangiana]
MSVKLNEVNGDYLDSMGDHLMYAICPLIIEGDSLTTILATNSLTSAPNGPGICHCPCLQHRHHPSAPLLPGMVSRSCGKDSSPTASKSPSCPPTHGTHESTIPTSSSLLTLSRQISQLSFVLLRLIHSFRVHA